MGSSTRHDPHPRNDETGAFGRELRIARDRVDGRGEEGDEADFGRGEARGE